MVEKKKGKCGICGKPFIYKQFKIKDITIDIPRYTCKCHEKIIIEKEAMEKVILVDALFKRSLIDELFIKNDFKCYNEKLRDYLNEEDTHKLLIVCGNPGNHKTGQVTAYCKWLMAEKLKSVLYYRTSKVPSTCIQRPGTQSKLESVHTLILDNFGLENVEKTGGFVQDIIDYRIHNYKDTILICNGDKEDLEEIYKTPLISRLKMFTKIEIDGEDKRSVIND